MLFFWDGLSSSAVPERLSRARLRRPGSQTPTGQGRKEVEKRRERREEENKDCADGGLADHLLLGYSGYEVLQYHMCMIASQYHLSQQSCMVSYK